MAELPREKRAEADQKLDHSDSKKRHRGSRSRSTKAKSHLEVIEQLLHKPVEVLKDRRPTKMPTLGAIISQLMQKSLAGDRKADRVLKRYEQHADENSASELEIVFVDNQYTKAFAASGGDDA